MSDKAPKKKVRAKPAAKKKAAKEDDKSEAPKDESAPVVQMGPSPQATVMARHEYSSQERRGKGFSFGELAAAGVSFVIARSLSVPVDLRRRSTLDGNVDRAEGLVQTHAQEGEGAEAGNGREGRQAEEGKEGSQDGQEEREDSEAEEGVAAYSVRVLSLWKRYCCA